MYVTGADINDEKGEPQDKKGEMMIGILSSMNETLKGVKGDTSKMLEKQDETIDAIDRSKEEIVTEISSLRQPFSFSKRKALAEKKKILFNLLHALTLSTVPSSIK
ncbi:MAG: hypothetical protein IMF19_11890 [Proteobacteria bacterium]|nr:hypothetical protein [Pseudomonadota bacterium]